VKAVLYTFRRADPVLGFAEDFPELDWSFVWSPEELVRALPGAEVLVLNNRICTKETGAALARGRSPALRWIHFVSAGIERGIAMGLPDDVPVTTSAGTKARVVAEHAMTLLLAASRRLADMHEAQRRHEWARVEINGRMRSLEGATLAVIGMGAIGREVARKARAFDMDVIGVSRRGAAGGDFAEAYPRARMAEALSRADAVVVATDSDPSSHHLIDDAALAAMKPTAYLVNVARGEIVDEAALVRALAEGALAGAALDVTEEEPLDPASPLWDMANVIVSPHVSGGGSNGYPKLRDLFAENLARLGTGRPLVNRYQAAPAEAPA